MCSGYYLKKILKKDDRSKFDEIKQDLKISKTPLESENIVSKETIKQLKSVEQEENCYFSRSKK